MTNEEKQIEEMAKDIHKSPWKLEQDWRGAHINGEELAEYFYNKGYRKASDVAREIFAEIEKIIEVDKFGEAKFDVRELYKIEKKYESEGGE